jgi:hypothetical protein
MSASPRPWNNPRAASSSAIATSASSRSPGHCAPPTHLVARQPWVRGEHPRDRPADPPPRRKRSPSPSSSAIEQAAAPSRVRPWPRMSRHCKSSGQGLVTGKPLRGAIIKIMPPKGLGPPAVPRRERALRAIDVEADGITVRLDPWEDAAPPPGPTPRRRPHRLRRLKGDAVSWLLLLSPWCPAGETNSAAHTTREQSPRRQDTCHPADRPRVLCQRPSCGPRWWPGRSPHPSG